MTITVSRSGPQSRATFDDVLAYLRHVPLLRNAACRDYNGQNLWDHEIDGEGKSDRDKRHKQARAICATCLDKAECLATRKTDDFGIRGGRLFTPPPRKDTPKPPVVHSPGRFFDVCRCGAPLPDSRKRQGCGTCGPGCSGDRRRTDRAALREERTRAEVTAVLTGSSAGQVSSRAKSQLAAYWTAEGHDDQWIARRLGIGLRKVQVHRHAAHRQGRKVS